MESLDKYRNEIDRLDRDIIALLQERANNAVKIGEIKREKGEPVFKPGREKEVYKKIKSMNKGPLADETLVAIYREIMSGSIALEKGIQVGYLGPEGSFSHEAVRAKFGSSIDTEALASIPEVFRAVETGKLDYGVVPVENSSEGLVNSTLDQLQLSGLKIYSEMYIRISLNLIGLESDLRKIKKLYGLKIANSQCKNWINANLPHVEIVETSSTARAAELVAEKKDGVAIASAIAADIYGLNIIKEGIEDLPNNSTRFLILSTNQCEPSGEDKTSIVFSVRDKPGSLYSILKPFHDRNINLTKIESRPDRKSPWQYIFFIDFYGHQNDAVTAGLIEELEHNTSYLRVLGSYPAAETDR